MNVIQKSEAIKAGLRKGFQDGSSKMAHRKCYGYEVCSDGGLVVNSEEAKVVGWIFEQYLAGNNLGKIVAGLERKGIPSPTGRPKWNREAVEKLLSNGCGKITLSGGLRGLGGQRLHLAGGYQRPVGRVRLSLRGETCSGGLPRKELEKVRRMLMEYGLSGWDMTYILPADKALHDKMKKKEKK